MILVQAFGKRSRLLDLLRGCGFSTFFYKFSGHESQRGGFLRWSAFGAGPELRSLKRPHQPAPLILCLLAKAVGWEEAMRKEKFNQEGNVVLMPSDPCACAPASATDPTDVAKTKIPKQVCCRETAVMR